MNKRRVIPVLVSVLVLFALVGAVYAGGWAIVTLSEFPDYVVAGKPLNLTFAVRQHGVTLLSDLHPKITATDTSGNAINGKVAAGSAKGEYSAAMTLPQPGDWKITIDSGFNGNISTLPALKVIAADSPAPTPFAPGTRGVRLFTAKGCVGCHRHIEVNPEHKTDAKFDLTGRRFPNDYLKKFLADPSIKPAEMPNLKLKDDEIEALAAFINKAVKKQVER
jgi:mono/diheme cytochrome c family protein